MGPLFYLWGNLCKFGLDFSAVRFRRVSGTLTTIFKMAEKENIGYIAQVIGPVVDVHFDVTDEEAQLPRIHDALDVERGEGKRPLVIEVQQHIGEDTVRCVAMDSTRRFETRNEGCEHSRSDLDAYRGADQRPCHERCRGFH